MYIIRSRKVIGVWEDLQKATSAIGKTDAHIWHKPSFINLCGMLNNQKRILSLWPDSSDFKMVLFTLQK